MAGACGRDGMAEMTKNCYFLPMSRALLIGFDGMQTLDVTGPAEVFAMAGYAVEVLSTGGGARETSSSIVMQTRDLACVRPRASDVVLVAGGGEAAVRAAIADACLLSWLRRAAPRVRRIGSVCSGAFVLAAAGILDGKRAATHWSATDRLARAFPRTHVDADAIFVQDGNVWTSAGVTTGIDLSLAIVEEDHGRALADSIAARLVLYLRRPGFQSQFSEALVAQTEASDPLGAAIAWTRANLAKADVESFARRAGLSVRTLHRRCLEVLGTTPARLIDRLRVERARALLETSDLPAKTLAAQCGFGNTTRMKRAFERELGIAPREYRLLHAG